MPMIWDAAADAKLMATMMRVCDVKLSQEHYDELGKAMGCTAKAIKHRIGKVRNAGKDGKDAADGEQDTDAAPTKTAAKAPKPRATKTRTNKKKNGRKTAAAARTPSPPAADGDDDDEQVNGAAPTPPPSSRPKRGGVKRNYAQLARVKGGDGDDEGEGEGEGDEDGEGDGLGKKVKIEVGEDIGEGLRQVNYFEDAMVGVGAGEGEIFS